MKYDDNSAARPSDRIWLNATVDPMLTRENNIEKEMVNKIAICVSTPTHKDKRLRRPVTYHSSEFAVEAIHLRTTCGMERRHLEQKQTVDVRL